MNDCSEDSNQTDEGYLLRGEVSDEAVEAASMTMPQGGLPTLWHGTYCFACPSRPAIGSQAPHTQRRGRRQIAANIAKLPELLLSVKS
jgi:hypothetical protein